MMRFGCGAHIVHGHAAGHGARGSDDEKHIDPVYGEQISSNEGYGKIHSGRLYRFSSGECLDTFDTNPERYAGERYAGERKGAVR